MLQRHVHEVLDDAAARAAEIESRALARAAEVEQDSQRRANEIAGGSQKATRKALDSALKRAEGMLGATETLQIELGKVIDSFKSEIENLTTELRSAKDTLAPAVPDQAASSRAAAPEPPQPSPPAQPVAQEEPGAQEEAAPEAEPAAEPEPEPAVETERTTPLPKVFGPEEPAKGRRRGLLRRD